MHPDTEKIFNELKSQKEVFDNLLLVGGTALAIHRQHRISEDLDFASASIRLNRKPIEALIMHLGNIGYSIEDITPIEAYADFANAGLHVADYQQDYSINGIKTTFFAFGKSEEERDILRQDKASMYGNIPVASVDTIFKMKTLLITERIKSRDFFDLYSLLKNGEFSLEDMLETMKRYRSWYPLERFKNVLLNSTPPLDDEGFQSLVSESITFADIQSFFSEKVDEYEQLTAYNRFLTDNPRHGPGV